VEIVYKGRRTLVAKGQIDVMYRPGTTVAQRDAVLRSLELRLRYRDARFDYVSTIDPSSDLPSMIEKLQLHEEVQAADPNVAADAPEGPGKVLR